MYIQGYRERGFFFAIANNVLLNKKRLLLHVASHRFNNDSHSKKFEKSYLMNSGGD